MDRAQGTRSPIRFTPWWIGMHENQNRRGVKCANKIDIEVNIKFATEKLLNSRVSQYATGAFPLIDWQLIDK